MVASVTRIAAHAALTRTRTRFFPLGVASLLGAAALLAGCSGGGNATPTDEPTIGGTAVCDEASLTAVIRDDVDQTYPGATFVSLQGFECVDGWAAARADVDTNGVTVTTAFYLQAEGQFWVPMSIEVICSTAAEDSDVPESIYVQACGLQD